MSQTRWIVVACVGIACVGLILAGYGAAAFVVLAAGGVIGLARRGEPEPRGERGRRVRTKRFVEVAELPHPCDVVWAFIKPAETSPLWEPSIRRGYHVPGTPLGLGERQAFESIDGTTTVIEIVEYEPGRRAVTMVVSPEPEPSVRSVYSLEPVEGGCALSLGSEIDVPAGGRVHPDYEDAWRTTTQAQLARLRHALAESHPDRAAEQP